VERTQGLLAVRGLRAGHAEDAEGRTGVTAVLFDDGVPTVVDARGGTTTAYDTASLGLDATFGRRHAVFFAGGSLYGLDAARGVRDWLVAHGAGRRAFGTRHSLVPVSGAVIFDLPPDDRPLPDYAVLGAEAAKAASRRPLPNGRVGAGTGATVGKYLGRAAGMAGGVGSSSQPLGRGHSVGVLVVVNAAGAIRDPANGRWVAAARGPRGRLVPPSSLRRRRLEGRGTTVALVATDLPLPRPALARIASIAHAGLARTIVPYATSVDGDCVFAVTTSNATPRLSEGWPGATADFVGRLAAEAAVDAVLAAVKPARSGSR
jgi:L-aminopeptidase/D-esterase-like protein